MQYEALVDPYVGILKSVDAIPLIAGEPRALTYYSASVGDLGRVLRWAPDLVGTGCAFSEQAARFAAVGEAIERYSANCPEKEITTASVSELDDNDTAFYDPLSAPMFLDAQYQRPGFPFKRLTPNDPIAWVPGKSLFPISRTVLLPAALVYLNYYRVLSDYSFTRHFPVLMSGVAAGSSEENATLSALLEVLERDAVELWWHGNLNAREIDISDRGDLSSTLRDGVDEATELRLLLLPTDHPVQVVVSVLISEPDDVLVMGSAARPNVESAVVKATAEAFQLRRVALALRDPDSWLWTSRRVGLLDYPVRSFMSDLRYRDSFAKDFSDMTQLAHNSQYYLDRRTWDAALARLSGTGTVNIDDVPDRVVGSGETSSELSALCRYLREADMRIYVCDITTSDIAPHGFRVTRVLVPEAMGNNPSAMPMLANLRLQKSCARSGKAISLLPMPHS